MVRKRHYDIPKPTWTCSHCGYVHVPASLLPLDSNNLQCRQCRRAFSAVPANVVRHADGRLVQMKGLGLSL